MLSRHADAAFWMGRYIERAEATARMVDVQYHLALESPTLEARIQWTSLLAISCTEEAFAERYSQADEASILRYFALDQENPYSIVSSVTRARENARSIRDQISSEMWEQLNAFYLQLRGMTPRKITTMTPHSFFTFIKEQGRLFGGIVNRTLLYGEVRDFIDTGRFLERADQTTRLLDVKYHDLLPRYTMGQSPSSLVVSPGGQVLPEDPNDVGGVVDIQGWTALLKSAGAFEAFQKTHHQGVSPTRVVDFLTLQPKFPASVVYSVSRVNKALRKISGNRDVVPINAGERAVGKLYSKLNFTTAEEIVASGLHEFLEAVSDDCLEIGNAIHQTYLRF